MKNNALRLRTFFLALIALFSTCFAANAAGVLGGVLFGTPQEYDGACVGRGVCKNSVWNVNENNPDAVAVSFDVLASSENILVMSFSLSELQSKQPGRVASFTESNNYPFDAMYSLTDNMFAPLNLKPNARILPSGNNTIQISGDVVTVYIPYAHD